MELLIRIRDKKSDDPYLDCQLTKRGDVIVYRPDGWEWSNAERTNPDWIIIQVPISDAVAQSLCEPEPGDPKLNKMLQRRGFKLDLDNPPKAVVDAIKNYNGNPIVVTKAVIDNLKKQKTELQDPNIIGSVQANVIG